MKQLAGLAAGGLSLAGYPAYLRGVRRGQIRPALASWWAWLLACVVALGGQAVGGAGWAMVLVGAQVVGMGAVVAAARRTCWALTASDRWCVVLSLVGAAGGVLLSTPDLAIACVISGNVIAGLPTYRSVWRNPQAEGRLLWWCSAAAGGLSAVAASEPGIAGQGYGLYLLVANGAIALLAGRRPARHGASRERSQAASKAAAPPTSLLK
jgi:hypothetical protein